MNKLVDVRKSSSRDLFHKYVEVEKKILSTYFAHTSIVLRGAFAHLLRDGLPRLPRDLDHYIFAGSIERIIVSSIVLNAQAHLGGSSLL